MLKKYIAALSIVFALAIITIFVIMNHKTTVSNAQQATAQAFAPPKYFNEVKRFSEGIKQKCLPDNKTVSDALSKDDQALEGYPDYTYANTAQGSGIIDVPAGTNYNTTITTYDGKIATGSIRYEKGYGSYNYKLRKGATKKDWQLTSLVACRNI